MGGDPVLGQFVHLLGADLDLERLALGSDHRRVECLVHVGLRHRDEVLEAAGQRLPDRVDDADRAVAVLDRADDHPHRGEVEDLVELAALLRHLRVDRVEVLGAAGDLGIDAYLLQLFGEERAGLGHVGLALVALLGDQLFDFRVLARVERREGEVLELPLDRVDPETVRERRVDLQRLVRLQRLFLLRQRAERAHVVETVGQLDQDHPDVGGHRHHHLAVVLGLPLVAALEVHPGQLGDAVDQRGDLLAELLADLVQRRAGVLDRVVQQRRAQGVGIEPHSGADLRDPYRVGDEFVTAVALLVAVMSAGELEGARDLVAVDRRHRHQGAGQRRVLLLVRGVELLDHREQVAEQLLVLYGNFGLCRNDCASENSLL